MTTSHDTETPLSSTHPKPAAPHAPRMRKLALILIASAIIASSAIALYTNQQRLDHKIQILTADAITLKQQQTDAGSRLDSSLLQLASVQSKLNDRLEFVSKNLSKALQERLYQNNDWLLLKARYYLELAEINNHWSDNTPTTSALFQQADDLLANLHEPQLYVVRQAISREIVQLQATPAIDTVGILAKLDAAQQLLTDLPIKNPFTLTKNRPSVTTANKTSSDWREQVKNSLHQLKKLIIIRHHDETVEPLLSPEYESILRETCFLNLQEAQWAVLQRNHNVYQLTLTQAINTIKRTFDLNAPNTQAVLQQLNKLLQTQLDSKKPATGESLVLLNQIIDSKKNNAVVPSSSPAPEQSNEPDSSKIIPETNAKSPVAGAKS